MSSLPIADYGLVSDCHSAALVSRMGSVDWLCFPRFDAPSIFGRLLDDKAGHWSIHPTVECTTARRYIDQTLVLETTFRTSTGKAVLVDSMAVEYDVRSRCRRSQTSHTDSGRRLKTSALVEAVQQITLALDQIATLHATPALRREEIKLQIGLISVLFHVKGYGAQETRAAVERARLLIEQAEALGEPPEDPLLLFSVLYGFWVPNYVAFNGDVVRELAIQFLALAEKQTATAPLMIAHRLMGLALLDTADLVEGRAHLDRALRLYDPAEHRHLAARFGHDARVAVLSLQSLALCVLGFRHAALAQTERAMKEAREIGQAATLMYALNTASIAHVMCGNYAEATAIIDEHIALTDQTGSLFWRAWGTMQRGWVLALTGKPTEAIQTITSGTTAWRSTGSTKMIPTYLSHLAGAHAELGQFDDATRCIGEAMTAVETTKERWYEAEVIRIAGEIALLPREPDSTKAEAYFERALAVAREQQAKSWELRAAMSMARLWRVQGKQQQAHDLLASVYGWFTEGFDTLDLKQAKALLDEAQ